MLKVGKLKAEWDKRDLTDWLARALVDSANNPGIETIALLNRNNNKGGAYGMFYELTHNNAYFDVKWNIQRELGDVVKLGDSWYEFSAPGNIMFGFYGTAAGFSPEELYKGAGVAQLIDELLYKAGLSKHPEYHTEPGPLHAPFYGDTTDDHYAIQIGIELYSQYNKSGSLTASDLADTLSIYPNKNNLAIRSAPTDYQPTEESLPTDAFYNQ